MATVPESCDLVCYSHLRWNFVYQRPQHLLSRAARERRVFFVEEPVFDSEIPLLEKRRVGDTFVTIVVPHLPRRLSAAERNVALAGLMDEMFAEREIHPHVAWYYTPMALEFTRQTRPRVCVYDCMDQLSAFRGAPPELVQLERELLGRADVVFTGGHSLFEAKRDMHHNVHAFPSSVDVAHFAKGRVLQVEPADQTKIGRPRLGFAGVIDERFDIPLVDAVSKARPDWQLVLLGPVVKIDPTTLPQRANLHYLGSKSYDSLPAYLSGWDVAIMPFARNESTRYISPTKTPEYLAAGRRVVSTSITDVVRPYGEQNLVAIADQPDEFIAAVEAALGSADDAGDWAKRRDAFLATLSWDKTFYAMWKKVEQALVPRRIRVPSVERAASAVSLGL